MDFIIGVALLAATFYAGYQLGRQDSDGPDSGGNVGNRIRQWRKRRRR